MPLYPSWEDIALRLALTVLAGGIIGIDRGVRGHVAGLRTTILVALAAALAMVQANILLPVTGKTAASFGDMDMMRLPLGILTGVGFIGGGTILRRGDLVTGVTTAATLWVVTVIGLCFGGGQLSLGIAGTVLTVLTLSALRWLDGRIPREQRAVLVLRAAPEDGLSDRLNALIAPLGYHAAFQRQSETAGERKVWFELIGRRAEAAGAPLDLINLLNRSFEVARFELAQEPHN
ncbi:ATPase [Methylovirgula ligni]|uniref:Protein MgtC n=1 Tax=Methylovirgula ligni TaxID=569860 RepID=A0A3D9Z286_9HYPH|nr:MgtC/SapB family protein [Methylovirgula ligni]QAY95394.1 ATPase [Methylovirgula ligni]REF89284.1 putative Mg2+ transporter-C (MgtC) family protein [Methylovirgula ligni]